MPPLSSASRITSHPLLSTVLTGLSIAQLVAMAQVYFSNLHLFGEVSALHQAGYLEIPTLQSLQQLGTLGPTVFGGLFFTLSTGAGLTLATIVAVWIWHNLSQRNRPILILLLIIWVAGLLMVNLNGFNLYGSLYFALIPTGVSLVYLHCQPPEYDRKGLLRQLLPLYPLVCLAIIWGIQADNRLFINIRDFLLLSNPVGKSVNDFYYRYTLYPAEAFKSLEQKLQRPIRLTDIRPAALDRRVASQMRYRDYLVVGNDEPVELQIKQAGDHLDWLNNGSSNPGRYARIVLLEPERRTCAVQPPNGPVGLLAHLHLFRHPVCVPNLSLLRRFWYPAAADGSFSAAFPRRPSLQRTVLSDRGRAPCSGIPGRSATGECRESGGGPGRRRLARSGSGPETD